MSVAQQEAEWIALGGEQVDEMARFLATTRAELAADGLLQTGTRAGWDDGREEPKDVPTFRVRIDAYHRYMDSKGKEIIQGA